MATSYTFQLYSPRGEYITTLGSLISAEWARKAHQVGSLDLVLPYGAYDPTLFAVDSQIAVLRAVDSAPPALDGQTRYFVRKPERKNRQTLSVHCVDSLDLLRRRIIAYAAGSAQAAKSAQPADNLIKEFAEENCGPTSATTDSSRRYSSTYWAIAADTGAGPSIAKSASRRNLLTVCQEIAGAATQAGTYTTFDVVWTGALFELRTYTGQRGANRRYPSGAQPLVLSLEAGTLADVVLDDDATEEATFVYAAGQGEADARAVATAEDTGRSALSPFGRIEQLADARDTSSSAALQDEADTALRAARARRTFEARLVETSLLRWGLDLDYGDLVTCQEEGLLIDCRIDAYRTVLSADSITTDVQLRSM